MREPYFVRHDGNVPFSQAPTRSLLAVLSGAALGIPEGSTPEALEWDVGRRYAAILLRERGL